MTTGAKGGYFGRRDAPRTDLIKLREVAPDFIRSLFRGDYRPFYKAEHTAMLVDSLREAGLGE